MVARWKQELSGLAEARRGAIRLVCGAGLAAALSLSSNAADVTATKMRTVTFPDHLLANITYADPKKGRVLLKARGAVSFPEWARLDIFMNNDGALMAEDFAVLPVEQVERLHCNDLEIDDEAFVKLSRFKNLSYLNLNSTDVSDKSMPLIASMKRLVILDVSKSMITAAGAAKIVDLPLKSLILECNKLGPGGVKFLPRMHLVTTLKIGKCGLRDDDMKYVGQMTQLQSLSVVGSRDITSAGMTHLLKLKNLNCLEVQDSGITAVGLLKLKALPRLTNLKFRFSDFSPQDRALLTKELPGVQISDFGKASNMPIEMFNQLH